MQRGITPAIHRVGVEASIREKDRHDGGIRCNVEEAALASSCSPRDVHAQIF